MLSSNANTANDIGVQLNNAVNLNTNKKFFEQFSVFITGANIACIISLKLFDNANNDAVNGKKNFKSFVFLNLIIHFIRYVKYIVSDNTKKMKTNLFVNRVFRSALRISSKGGDK
ncbi:hypothetical protein PIROE2DRAFT_5802 [Piromyces sp. E2]|nr:hypothetical protein PIROE2DRAFT_5802 [Piromyces sp. E2]|eukprot:OUM66823.1 hypothetical protein PIROE2DRAFT_5802 [Piromyces sp. E2]